MLARLYRACILHGNRPRAAIYIPAGGWACLNDRRGNVERAINYPSDRRPSVLCISRAAISRGQPPATGDPRCLATANNNEDHAPHGYSVRGVACYHSCETDNCRTRDSRSDIRRGVGCAWIEIFIITLDSSSLREGGMNESWEWRKIVGSFVEEKKRFVIELLQKIC